MIFVEFNDGQPVGVDICKITFAYYDDIFDTVTAVLDDDNELHLNTSYEDFVERIKQAVALVVDNTAVPTFVECADHINGSKILINLNKVQLFYENDNCVVVGFDGSLEVVIAGHYNDFVQKIMKVEDYICEQ